MSDSLRHFLIRHGETAWSITGQHTGLTDIALTAHVEDEARALAPHLRTVHFSRILTSPLLRARQTGELAGLGPAAAIEPDLVEWNYGNYEGRRTEDIQEERAGWCVMLEKRRAVHVSVVRKSEQRLLWDRIYRVLGGQGLDIQGVRRCRILRAGARSKQPLRKGTQDRQPLPTCGRE